MSSDRVSPLVQLCTHAPIKFLPSPYRYLDPVNVLCVPTSLPHLNVSQDIPELSMRSDVAATNQLLHPPVFHFPPQSVYSSCPAMLCAAQ